jgi:N-acetylmuramoyl-L-alanine amidase
MNSPTHKDNILEPKYTRIGIGAIDGGPYGKMFSQEFIAYPNSTYAASNDSSLDILVYVNGELLYSDPPSYIEDDHTLVPAKQFMDALGLGSMVSTDGSQLTISLPESTINLTIDSATATVNGQEISLESAPKIKSGSIYVPLRSIADRIGATVNWDNKLRSIEVSRTLAQ